MSNTSRQVIPGPAVVLTPFAATSPSTGTAGAAPSAPPSSTVQLDFRVPQNAIYLMLLL